MNKGTPGLKPDPQESCFDFSEQASSIYAIAGVRHGTAQSVQCSPSRWRLLLAAGSALKPKLLLRPFTSFWKRSAAGLADCTSLAFSTLCLQWPWCSGKRPVLRHLSKKLPLPPLRLHAGKQEGSLELCPGAGVHLGPWPRHACLLRCCSTTQ